MPREIAARPSPGQKGDGAIEGTFIYKHGVYYYLFASIGYCCRGPLSTYRMVYGRSRSVTGPYVDADGLPMLEGGGTLLLKGDNNWYGVGGIPFITLMGSIISSSMDTMPA